MKRLVLVGVLAVATFVLAASGAKVAGAAQGGLVSSGLLDVAVNTDRPSAEGLKQRPLIVRKRREQAVAGEGRLRTIIVV